MSNSFAKRLDRQGPPMAISAVDARKLKPPHKTEICLQRVLMVDARDGLGPIINGAVHCELAPVLLGGAESLRLLLATGDLIRDWLATHHSGVDFDHMVELAGEMREALQRINALADSITAARKVADEEHDAFHATEAAPRGGVH